MLKSFLPPKLRYKWEHFEGGQADDNDWRTFVSPDEQLTATDVEQQNHLPKPLRFVYELFFITFIVLGAVIGLLWQQAEERYTSIEAQIKALSAEIVTLHVQGQHSQSARTESTEPAVGVADGWITLETAYFRFILPESDRQFVTTLATKADAHYGQLRQRLGLAAPDLEKKVLIGLHATGAPHGQPWTEPLFKGKKLAKFTFLLTSPSSMLAAGGTAVRQRFEGNFTQQTMRHLLDEALQARQTKLSWTPMINGLYRYLAVPAGPQSEESLSQVELRKRHRAQEVSLTHALQRTETSRSRLEQNDIADPYLTYWLADLILEYIFATYGVEIVPRLLDGFEEHEDWETLVPALFDQPISEFEAAWYAYLHTHYPKPPE